MKIKDLKGIIRSGHGDIQSTIIWSIRERKDIINGCSIEYAIKNYGELEMENVRAFDDNIVISVM